MHSWSAPAHSKLRGVAINAGGEVFVGENAENRVLVCVRHKCRRFSHDLRTQVFDLQGKLVRQLSGASTCKGKFGAIKGLALDRAGNLLVSDGGNSCIHIFRPDGSFLTAFSQAQCSAGICVDGEGRIWAGSHSSFVQVYGFVN